MSSPQKKPRAGWHWLLPRILASYRPRKAHAPVPDRPVCLGKNAGGRYVELQPPLVRRFEPLPIFPPSAAWMRARPASLAVAAMYRVELARAKIWGVQGWVGNERGEFLADLFSEDMGDNPFAAIQAAEKSGEPVCHLDGLSTTLLMPNHTNFFHWLWQGLPRFELLRPLVDQIDHWIVPPPDRPYLKESVAALGLDPRKIVYGRGVIHCERLWAASLPGSLSHTHPREFPARFVQSLFPARAVGTEASPPRIFVVRGAVNARQLINETAVAERLARSGFTTKSMDGMTLAEQARLFSNAEAVVAVHGAALANLIFCRPGAKIIELLPKNWPKAIYAQLSEGLGLSYFCLAGAEPALSWAPIENLSADLKIDIAQLDTLISQAGLDR